MKLEIFVGLFYSETRFVYLERLVTGPLTQEEIDSIDEAGRQGPPLGKAQTMWED